jgi:hypothetical protein
MLRTLLLAAVLLTLSGCAAVDRDDRRLAGALEDAFWPEKAGGKLLAAPLFAPVWLVAVTADTLLVNPVCFLPKAFNWSVDFCSLATFVMPIDLIAYPLRLLLWPFAFVGAEVVYCAVPL